MSKRDSHSDRRGFVYAPTQKMQWLVGLTPSIEHSLATPRGSTVAEPWCEYALLSHMSSDAFKAGAHYPAPARTSDRFSARRWSPPSLAS
jgi:hypothetical protein